MADYFFSTVKGAGLPEQVTRASSTASGTAELRVTYTSLPEKLDVIKQIEAIKLNIEQNQWPPA